MSKLFLIFTWTNLTLVLNIVFANQQIVSVTTYESDTFCLADCFDNFLLNNGKYDIYNDISPDIKETLAFKCKFKLINDQNTHLKGCKLLNIKISKESTTINLVISKSYLESIITHLHSDLKATPSAYQYTNPKLYSNEEAKEKKDLSKFRSLATHNGTKIINTSTDSRSPGLLEFVVGVFISVALVSCVYMYIKKQQGRARRRVASLSRNHIIDGLSSSNLGSQLKAPEIRPEVETVQLYPHVEDNSHRYQQQLLFSRQLNSHPYPVILGVPMQSVRSHRGNRPANYIMDQSVTQDESEIQIVYLDSAISQAH